MSELYDLLGRLANGEPMPERLKELLAADPEARRAYREYLNLHVALTSIGAMPAAVEKRFAWTPLAASVAAAAALLVLFSAPFGPEIRASAGARWRERSAGTLDLEAGFAEVRLANRVRLLLEAPARLRLATAGRVRLENGRVVAEVPSEARGFTIDTPAAAVVDLGTEFGVGVRDTGETEVLVYRGEVVADCRGTRHHLEAGKAVLIDPAAAPRGIEFQPERFVRMFPTDVDGGQPAGPLYNVSRLEAARVLPAPPGVVVDGELSEWPSSGAFRAACRPPFHESHTLEGRMMYDATHLYLAARVGDPAPMRSSLAAPAWQGGSVIVRLATGSAWPLEAKGRALSDSKNPDYGRRPIDVDERIVHLTLWYHRPSARPRLHLSYGLDFHGEVDEPAGWEGVFKARPDTLGYTLEYRIPWTLLNARPPRKGDVVPSNWTVHWSDHEGKVSRGHLVELTHLGEPPFRFLRGRCWGKALFD